METRIVRKQVIFRRPFRLVGIEEQLAPGTYTMAAEEEKLDTISLIGWRRIAVTLEVARGGATEHVAIDMQNLREALLIDGDQQTDPGVALGGTEQAWAEPARPTVVAVNGRHIAATVRRRVEDFDKWSGR